MDDGTSFIARRIVRAWQIRTPATWLAPGNEKPQPMPEGTWVIESVSNGDRWPVASHLFWGKYKLVRRTVGLHSLYVNVEQVRFEVPDDAQHLISEEGTQRLNEDDVIAVGSAGDRWPVPASRVGTTYRIDTPLNRLRLLACPPPRSRSVR